MKTYFLGKEEVGCYINDIIDRLVDLSSNLPLVWCAIGSSGEVIADQLLSTLISNGRDDVVDAITIVPLAYDKANDAVTFSDDSDKHQFNDQTPVLILDSAVHSGASMLAVVKSLRKLGVKSILSYSLVLKRNSGFIPNFFGLVIGEHDRALFLLDKFPNNRLCKAPPFGVVRELSSNDVHIDPQSLEVDLASLSKVTWSDLYYSKVAHGDHVYVLEVENIPSGFISFRIIRESVVLVDAVVIDKSLKGKRLGGVLLRWAETWARSQNCASIELWAIESRIEYYENQGFSVVSDKRLDLGDEKYQLMIRRLLYNLSEPLAA